MTPKPFGCTVYRVDDISRPKVKDFGVPIADISKMVLRMADCPPPTGTAPPGSTQAGGASWFIEYANTYRAQDSAAYAPAGT